MKNCFAAVTKFLVLVFVTHILNLQPVFAEALGNQIVHNFTAAKKLAIAIHKNHRVTIYCPCRYEGKVVDIKSCGYQIASDAKRATRLEWEHVVPAEAFGQAFSEWREGALQCRQKKTGKAFKGRKCAETNSEFAHMEADLYNLWPVIGELNALRSNYSIAQISGEAKTFGNCKAKIAGRKFEPMDRDKGIVARDYMYMDLNYPGRGIMSSKNKKLFEAWDVQYPVSDWECARAKLIQKIQANKNQILAERCK